MFRNILIPTDGSDLAAKAVEQGVLFAKEIGAKITAVTVTEPFHFLSVSPSQLEYTPIEYQKYSKAHAEKVLGVVSAVAKSAGVVYDPLHVEHELVYQAVIQAVKARKCVRRIWMSIRLVPTSMRSIRAVSGHPLAGSGQKTAAPTSAPR
jgi:nucleotide-binding universal stress UspA family protein